MQENESSKVVEAALKTISSSKRSTSMTAKGVLGLIGALVAVVAITVLYFRMRKQGAALAKLKHERDAAKERETRLAVAAKTVENTALRKELLAKAGVYETTVASLNERIEEVVVANADAHAKIDALKTWGDVDAYLSK